MRIAGPLLAVTTPIGCAWGLVEAFRISPWLAVVMALLLTVIGGFMWMTVARIRREARDDAREGAREKRP